MEILDDFEEDYKDFKPGPLVIILLSSFLILSLGFAAHDIYIDYTFDNRQTGLIICFLDPYRSRALILLFGLLGIATSIGSLYFAKFRIPKSIYHQFLYCSPILIFILDFFMYDILYMY